MRAASGNREHDAADRATSTPSAAWQARRPAPTRPTLRTRRVARATRRSGQESATAEARAPPRRRPGVFYDHVANRADLLLWRAPGAARLAGGRGSGGCRDTWRTSTRRYGRGGRLR
ncbi:hypothetical protein LV779_34985 [Streptomyces thinghirensis]|nr:hypothetical protein [Streptomyces thinghirensis]